MKKFLIEFDNKIIHIVSIDGNHSALDIQRKLIKRFFPNVADFFQKQLILSHNNFKNELQNTINYYNITKKFDIIMSFRFINEFYREELFFCWNEIPGSANEKVIEYLREANGVYRESEVMFENDGTTINISNDKSSLSLKIEDWETAILRNDGKIIDDFILKRENNKTNLYLDKYDKNKGMYKIIIEAVSDYLDDEGLFILSDVTDEINGNTNLLVSKIMNKEIVEYLNGEDPKLKVIIPLSCAFWHKYCRTKNCFTRSEVFLRIRTDLRVFKYCYKVFSNKELAYRVLENKKYNYKQDTYNIDNGENRACKKGYYSYRDRNAINYRDAFSFENIE